MRADLAAATQQAIAETLADRVSAAFHIANEPFTALVVAGGVAANQTVRAALTSVANQNHVEWIAPPMEFCTDNAAMISWAAIERARAGISYPADTRARPRWPLDAAQAT